MSTGFADCGCLCLRAVLRPGHPVSRLDDALPRRLRRGFTSGGRRRVGLTLDARRRRPTEVGVGITVSVGHRTCRPIVVLVSPTVELLVEDGLVPTP